MDTSHTPGRKRQRYSDVQQAAALATLEANAGNVAATARATGIPEDTIRSWVKGERRPYDPALVQDAKRALADKWDAITESALAVCAEKLPKASAAQAALIAGLGTDKSLILRGEPTSITSTAEDERLALFRERYNRIRPCEPPGTLVVQDTTPQSLPGAPGSLPDTTDGNSPTQPG